jgi:uncharacterized protein YjiS (DUF1127 family)
MSVGRSAKRLLAPAAKTLAPRLFWRRKYGILQHLGESRPDVTLVRSLCDPNRISLDIGADVGEFAIAMLTSSRSEVKRLDDLQLDDIGLVKIDVEGHELAVVRGAVDTLKRNRPTIVVEAEERHHANAVSDITELLAKLGYRGYFCLGSERRPIAEFDATDSANIGGAEDDWPPRGVYVNNFAFVPEGD